VTSEILAGAVVNPKPERKRGDPALLDRLNRARGAYMARTGKEVQWKDLAEAAGLGLSTMTDITTLDRRVTIADAAAFADYLGVEFAWLALGRGPMTAQPPAAHDGPAPEVRQERPSDSMEVSHLGTPKRHRRRSNGNAG
jgi:hypothetical protein